ncbi:MAG: L,D-transpeptidase [Leptolyngbyaceae cyanobacterium MO_188.B28]|nr:L,D-transpeptidase [Leptolyngbyaceae cyanobacterium MO_188.B28]
MLTHQPITRCFMTLCFGAAALLAAAEWRSQPFETPELLGSRVEKIRAAALMQRILYKDIALVVSLQSRQLKVYQKDEVILSFSVAVGQDEWQTPLGQFRITQMEKEPVWRHPITGEVIESGPDNPLGVRWIGFWSDGKNQIGFHGTNQEDSIGQAVSHGCIRLRNQDILDLYDQVGIGVPVMVTP